MDPLPPTRHIPHDASAPDWERLGRYFAGESDASERSLVERELAEHPDRAALIRALRAGRAEPAELTADEVEAALARVLAGRGATVTPLAARRQWRTLAMRAAAAVLVVAGGAYAWRMSSTRDSAVTSSPSRTYATAVGALDSLRLPDGTRVVLGPGSSLRVDTVAYRRSRVVALRGQALFDVVHDAARPFAVRTGVATLRDVGTAFAVESDAEGTVRVSVREGAVAIEPADVRVPPADTLHAGDRGTVSARLAVRVSRGSATADDFAWMQKRLVFRDAPLSQVADGLRRWYGLQLRIEDSTLAARHLTATFDTGMRDDVGQLLGAVLGATASQHGDTIELRPTAGSAAR